MRRLLLLISSLVLVPGCGMFLDLDPPDDGAVGMDGGGRSDGGRADGGDETCTLDEQCDDGDFCNGSEICDGGECRGGEEPTCDDGVGCTRDRCDADTGSCVYEPDDSMCPETPVGCTGHVCDTELGCQLTFDDSECDDSIPCTFDACTSDGCENVPNDGDCPAGQFCDLAAGMCRHPPDCSEASDCPARSCNQPPRCESGVCRYTPTDFDPTCSVVDPCTPTTCVSGSCVIGTPVTCTGISDARSCLRNVCVKNTAGAVTCQDVDRDGEPCPTIAPCTTGACAGSTCVEMSTCVSTDPCVTAVCFGAGGCSRVAVDCGVNAMCGTGVGGIAECVCDMGWRDCDAAMLGCECSTSVDAGVDAGRPEGGTSCAGPLGWIDCSGDGTCDCNPVTSMCDGMGGCTCLPCGSLARCCDRTTNACYDPGGASCITP